MKTCPFCAEKIQDAAIVCRYCGRDLPATGSGKAVEEGGKAFNQITHELPHLPPDYKPPVADVESIYRLRLAELKKGGWMSLAEGAYLPRNYGSSLKPQEFSKLFFSTLQEILERAWSQCDQTPDDLRKHLIKEADKIKASIFSAKSIARHVFAAHALRHILAGLENRYSRESVAQALKGAVHKLFQYALTTGNMTLAASPAQRLERYEEDKFLNPKKDIAAEIFPFALNEAKRLIAGLGENPTQYERRALLIPDGFAANLAPSADKVLALIRSTYWRPLSKKDPSARFITESELAEATNEVVKGIAAYQSNVRDGLGRGLVSERVRSRLIDENCVVLTDEEVRRYGLG